MRWLIALAVVGGCRKSPRPPPPPPDAGDSACVTACVKRDQMRATSIEEIQRGCRAECSE